MAVPLMPAGGRIVFVTSHAAHFFPHKAVPKGQTAVAASKWAGETALYAMRSEFRRAGVHLTVVSGDMVDATFAGAIVNAANTPNPSAIVFVGGADYADDRLARPQSSDDRLKPAPVGSATAANRP